MSSSDSFIDEVGEELRRDRLYGYVRKYGWIAVAGVVALVGAAAYTEWQRSAAEARARALGDAAFAALAVEDAEARAEALTAAAGSDDAGAADVLGLLAAAELASAGDTAAARDRLETVASNATDPLLRDLAALKSLALAGPGEPAAERRLALEALAAPGAPFRLLAQEQLALLDIEAGETESAVSRLQAIGADAEASAGARGRAADLLMALGATPAGAATAPPDE